MRCSKCSDSCGDDFKTKTNYALERNLGDRLKVVLLQIYDMVDEDNLQVSDIKALIASLIDEHIEESDELNPVSREKLPKSEINVES
jgi:hypothetical protein